jgi:quercetin dioxygenase-like cupin family protein
MSTPDEAIVLGPGEGKAVQAMGNQLSYKAVGEDTDSRYALVEFAVAPGFGGTPPHIHHSSEEAIYVLQGEMQVRVGDRTIPASAGSFVLVPRGVVHTLSNPSTTPARVLTIFSPAGFEKYFEEIAALSAAGRSPDLATIVALGKKYDSELVGQPEV